MKEKKIENQKLLLDRIEKASLDKNENYNPSITYWALTDEAKKLNLEVILKIEVPKNIVEYNEDKNQIFLEYYNHGIKTNFETVLNLADGKAKIFVEKLNKNNQLEMRPLERTFFTDDYYELKTNLNRAVISYISEGNQILSNLGENITTEELYKNINFINQLLQMKEESDYINTNYKQREHVKNNSLSFIDRYITPRTKEYKNFVKELENTPSERFYQDGERQFTEQEKKYLAIYNFKNGIENTPKTITTEKKWEMDNEMEIEGTGMSFYMQHEKNQEKMENENIIIGGKISEIAGKTLTDKNYLSLFDKNTQNTINEYMRVTPNIQPVALSEDDKIAISQQNQQQNMENKPLSTIMQEIKNFTAEEKTYLRENLLLQFGQNTYSPIIFRELSEISDESVKKVEDFLNKFKEEYFTLLLEKGKIKSDDDLSIFDDLIDNILVQMEKNDEIRNEINPVYLSMIYNREKIEEEQNSKKFYKSESVTDFYKNYVINPKQALSYHDIFAFVVQSGTSHLKDILEKQYPKITFPKTLNVNSIEENIITPIQDLSKEEIKNFKEQLETFATNSLKTIQIKESTADQEQKDWNKYYQGIRKNIDPAKTVSHTDIYALINAKHIPAIEKMEIVKKFLPNFSRNLSKLIGKSRLLQEIVYPLRENNHSEAFKSDLKKLYNSYPEKESYQSNDILSAEMTQKAMKGNISEFYTNYMLNYDINKNITHIPIYAYVNLPIPTIEKMETLNNLARELGWETEFVVAPEELQKLSKNKILNKLVYPLRENAQSLEEEFKLKIQTSFIESRENKKNYAEILDNLEINFEQTDKINIDIVNKILKIQEISISELAESLNLSIKSNSETFMKIEFIKEVNNIPKKVENLLEQLKNRNFHSLTK